MKLRWLLAHDDDRGDAGVVEHNKSEVTIGSVPGNDLVLEHADVEARHARIVVKDGKFILVDLRSSSGTAFNGRRIGSPVVIRETDRFTIGPYTLQVEDIVEPDLRDDEPLTEDEIELLTLIAASPGDDDPRMVYADHLMDRGDPHGEFIALQCELARTPEPRASDVERRLRDLLARNPDSPTARLVTSGVAFSRGFLRQAMCTTPARRDRNGPGLHRVSPAVYELGELTEQFVATNVYRGRRVLPSGEAGDVVIFRWGSSMMQSGYGELSRLGDQLALNQVALRESASGAVAEHLELVRHDKSGQLGLAVMWPFGTRLAEVTSAMPPRAAIAIAADLCRALERLDDVGVHVMALNPAHVVIGPAGDVSIADITWVESPTIELPYPELAARAFITSNRLPMAPPFRTMAPEAFGAGRIGPASGVFVVSVVLHQLLTGHHPFPGGHADARGPLEAIEYASRYPLPPMPGVPDPLHAMCARGLSVTPTDRFATVAELAAGLEDIASRRGWSTTTAAVADALK